MKIWRLKRGADARFRRGYPWIFASELAHSAKEVWPGEVVELRDFQERFLAYGYTHPASQICFRRLTSRAKERDVLSERFFVERLRAARELRVSSGVAWHSHRWLYAESDGVPGLIVDAFSRADRSWVVVAQASTAGIEAAKERLFAAFAAFEEEMGEITIVEAPSSKTRKLEGLAVAEKKVVSGPALDLENSVIRLREGLSLNCDLLRGQKTGFFLDQQANAALLRGLVRHRFKAGGRAVRILDVCCYVGQWSSHAAHALHGMSVASEVTLLDVSKAALGFAEKNLKFFADDVRLVEGDAIDKLSTLPVDYFDVVICDPPAFVKKKADLPQGLKGYIKLNRQALRLVKPGGLYVASSCSGLVKSEDWREVLVQSSLTAGRMFKELVRGGHAPDHPVRPEFPEGEYLKCSIGRIEYPY